LSPAWADDAELERVYGELKPIGVIGDEVAVVSATAVVLVKVTVMLLDRATSV
jgi:hypothetical protein